MAERGLWTPPAHVRRRPFGGGLWPVAEPDRLEDQIVKEDEGRRVFRVLAVRFGILLLRGFSAGVVHPQRREDLVTHEREERLARCGFDRQARQDPVVVRIAVLSARFE